VTELANRTVLVTGASKGIGAEIVRAVGAAGAHVIAHYNSDPEGARAAVAGLPAERVHLAQADFAEPAAARRLWQDAIGWRGHVGVLVTMTSWVAQRGSADPDLVAYSASKAAIKAATQTLARAYAAQGLLCYMIAPGMVRTRMSEVASARRGGEPGTRGELAMGSWVPPAEVADLVVFLASGTRRHLSGATFDVNGATYVR
jgi:NAD(P)-dependent dehydrogenase (short-subunit alcohol dehydrogenase family)